MNESTHPESHELGRFLTAQEKVYLTALEELREGHKQTHWMWYIFPQVAGLGQSSTTVFYAIRDRAEARAYLDHPVLGQRLRECTLAVLKHKEKPVREIFSFPDDLKFHSSMTLFEDVDDPGGVFRQALDTFFNGSLDLQTVKHLK